MVAGGAGWAGCISIISRLETEIKYIKYENTKDILLVKIKYFYCVSRSVQCSDKIIKKNANGFKHDNLAVINYDDLLVLLFIAFFSASTH